MGYAGWHSVCDNSHSLLCISYEPIDGTLACRFQSSEQPYLYAGVPENIYQILLRSKFAGSYLRKYVIGRYQCLNQKPPAFKPTSDAPAKKLRKMAAVRLEALPETTMDLFGVVTPIPSQRRHRRA